MIVISDCKQCIHVSVCSIKQQYKDFDNKIRDIEIYVSVSDNTTAINRIVDTLAFDIIFTCKEFIEKTTKLR